jgi:hypothetical protein
MFSNIIPAGNGCGGSISQSQLCYSTSYRVPPGILSKLVACAKMTVEYHDSGVSWRNMRREMVNVVSNIYYHTPVAYNRSETVLGDSPLICSNAFPIFDRISLYMNSSHRRPYSYCNSNWLSVLEYLLKEPRVRNTLYPWGGNAPTQSPIFSLAQNDELGMMDLRAWRMVLGAAPNTLRRTPEE